jgi:endonuclease-3
MRASSKAAIDTMGCEETADKSQSESTQRFQVLISLMLSSQTKDEVNHAACMRLRQFGFTVENIAKADVNELEDIIKPVGFYRQKAKHIKEAANVLLTQYNSDVPNDLNELLKLKGVGPKMANLALAICWNNVIGIGVDVHVHRISNRLQWVNNTKTPLQTEAQLESWLPKEYWLEVNQ